MHKDLGYLVNVDRLEFPLCPLVRLRQTVGQRLNKISLHAVRPHPPTRWPVLWGRALCPHNSQVPHPNRYRQDPQATEEAQLASSPGGDCPAPGTLPASVGE